jgi:hypothetical protein
MDQLIEVGPEDEESDRAGLELPEEGVFLPALGGGVGLVRTGLGAGLLRPGLGAGLLRTGLGAEY